MKLFLNKVRINKGGYSDSGMYFGVGLPVYQYYTEYLEMNGFVRATDREDAKRQIREHVVGAEFYK